MRKWANLEDRLQVWRVVKDNDGSKELNVKTSRLYEVLTLLSVLCCASLIGLSNSNNENISVVYLYDGIRAYGIIVSVLSGVFSITLCSLITATSNDSTYLFMEQTIKFSNVPFFGIIFSLICLVLSASLHFRTYVMIATLPLSVLVIGYCFYFYGCVHKIVHSLVKNRDSVELNNLDGSMNIFN